MPGKTPSIDEALSQGRSLENSGNFAQAEHVYLALLERFPASKLVKKRLKSIQRTKSGRGQSASVAPPAEAAINVLVNLSRQGRLLEALEQGGVMSEKHPDDPTIHNILGVIHASMGNAEAALARYDRALKIRPGFAEVHNNRGNLLNRLGQRTEAISCFRKAIKIKPQYAEAHNGMGNALHDVGELEEAIASYRAALKIRPDYVDALNNMGNAFADQGQAEAALASFKAALRLNPGFAQAYYNMGNTLRFQGKHEEAIASFEKAIALRPDYAMAFNSMGNTLNEQGMHQQAIDCLTQAIQIDPAYGEAHTSLGNALNDLRRHGEAVSSYRAALEINPGFAEGHCNLGNALNDLGQYEEAIACYQQALHLKPDFAEVHNNISQIKTFHSDDVQITQMQKCLADPNITENETMHLAFALGKARDDLGDYDQAFEFFQQGNQLKKEALGYNISQDRAQFELIKSVFGKLNPESVQGNNIDHQHNKQPIFIVGMPRSGTSLVEQILASHSRVFGAGELEVLGRILSPLLRELPLAGPNHFGDEVLAGLKNTYLSELDQLPGAEPCVTDKMPMNFKWIGFLLLAMPGLKIINLRRHPAAICWSMFRHYFGANGNGYSYDLEDVAEYYNLYTDLMEFWRLNFPGQIYDLNYEALTENQEDETRRLLDYCGLEWEEQCLEFHETRRSVQTVSGIQVRQAMYSGSSRAWHNYEAHLQPMLKVLGIQALEPIEE